METSSISFIKEVAAELNKHHQSTGQRVAMGVTCECGYWTGNDSLNSLHQPLPWGRDRLDLHRAQVILKWLVKKGTVKMGVTSGTH